MDLHFKQIIDITINIFNNNLLSLNKNFLSILI